MSKINSIQLARDLVYLKEAKKRLTNWLNIKHLNKLKKQRDLK